MAEDGGMFAAETADPVAVADGPCVSEIPSKDAEKKDVNETELRRKFPNASASFIAANSTGRKASRAKPEPAVCDEFLAKASGTKTDGARFSIRITSFRARLCDPDNLVGKYFVDCIRYAGLIPDDTAAVVDYSIRQEKVPKKDQRTEILIEPL